MADILNELFYGCADLNSSVDSRNHIRGDMTIATTNIIGLGNVFVMRH